MAVLSRKAPKLLRTVGGRSHATQDDHEEVSRAHATVESTKVPRSSFSVPRNDEEDINADPISSGDDEDPRESVKPDISSQQDRAPTGSLLGTSKSSKSSSKRTFANISFTSSAAPVDDDFALFGSSSSQPRQTRSHALGTNIHAKPSAANRSQTIYGKRGLKGRKIFAPRKTLKKVDGPKNRASFKRLDATDTENDHGQDAKAQKPKFKIAGGEVPMSSVPTEQSSDLSSAHEEDLEFLEVTEQEHSSTIDCNICNSRVEKMIWESFEDKYHCGKHLSYKWAQRFCRFHREEEARREWEDYNYPTIDWARVPHRLASRDRVTRLDAILSGRRRALFQDAHERRVKGRKKTALQAASRDDGDEGEIIGAGYYGPRGEKLIMDYILREFSDKLRRRATEERVVAAAGVSGGIAGFVHAILVPELVVSLISEDCGKNAQEAMQIMVDTTAIGELLHPEIEDEVDGTMLDDDESE